MTIILIINMNMNVVAPGGARRAATPSAQPRRDDLLM